MNCETEELMAHPMMPLAVLLSQVAHRFENGGDRTASVQINSQTADGKPLMFDVTVTMRHMEVH